MDWEASAKAILGRLEGFQLWLSNQAIGVCATQKNTACIQDIIDDRCPNCDKRGEDNQQLNCCTDPGRVHLFHDGVRKLTKWMWKGNQTDTEHSILDKGISSSQRPGPDGQSSHTPANVGGTAGGSGEPG